LRNRKGMIVKITNYGGKVEQILVPDRNGELGDVALGYDSIDAVLAGQPSMGAFIGRFANRIRNARFPLNGETVATLSVNAGQHSLHGGTRGSRFRVFAARQLDDSSLELMYVFQDGEEGYPGTLPVRVIYSVTDENALRMEWSAAAIDKETVANFTNHTFFNLGADPTTPVLDTEVTINADRFIALDEGGFPSGELRTVDGSALDFRAARSVAAGLALEDEQVRRANGFDHHFILNRQGTAERQPRTSPRAPTIRRRAGSSKCGAPSRACSFSPATTSPASCRSMPARTARPSSSAAASAWSRRVSRIRRTTRSYPSTSVKPGEFYTGCIEYRFSTR
jgi:aldose 1-epimerase